MFLKNETRFVESRSEEVLRTAYFIPVRDGRRVWPNRVLVGASWPVWKGTGRAESSDAQK